MPGGIVMIEDVGGERSKLNKVESDMNRGFELLLRNKKRRRVVQPPKTFQVKFGNAITLFGREFRIFFEFHLNVKKKLSGGEEKC